MGSIENKATFFRDDIDTRVRQIKIIPGAFPFKTLHSIANLQFRTQEQMECIIITPLGRLILTPEYVKKVQALPYEQTLDHILETAIKMRRASSVHIIYKAPVKNS